MEHNFASFTGRSNEEIMEDNKKKYLDEIKPSWTKQKWYYKMSRKKLMQTVFMVGIIAGSIIQVVIYIASMLIREYL